MVVSKSKISASYPQEQVWKALKLLIVGVGSRQQPHLEKRRIRWGGQLECFLSHYLTRTLLRSCDRDLVIDAR